jgi:hypothetical protein
MNIKHFFKTNILKHFLVITIFIITSLIFFHPVISGKKILQNDIIQYTGMSKELKDFRSENGYDTYWTNNSFSGMPTYQLGAKFPHNYIKKLDLSLRFLPRPADYLFLYFLGFYLLMMSLKVDYRLAVFGALSFGLSTYLIIIIGAGHNAKAHAISYMPFVLASIIYVTRGKYFLGFLFTTISLALQFTANHFQMTYYLGFIVISLAVWFVYQSIKSKNINHLLKTASTLLISLLFAILLNASNLMTTIEYSNESTRGDYSSLSINPDGSDKEIESGLKREYITQWSYGIFESLNLFIPKIMGGGSSEELGINSYFFNFLKSNGYSTIEAKNIVKNSPTYWGDQPFVEAPAYLGIVVFFLFVFSVFLYRGKHKGWLLAAIITSLLLSFGKNFDGLTDLFISYFPLYNKFRAVSSIQVILELCIPILAVFGLSSLINSKNNNLIKSKALYSTLFFFAIILIILYFSFDYLSFSGQSDLGLDPVIKDVLIDDRKSIFLDQLARTLIYVIITFTIILLYIKSKIKLNITLLSLILISSFDLIGFSKAYVNESNFTDSYFVENPFSLDETYKNIMSDDSDFRVLDLTESSTRPNFYLNSINGYHAAKLGRYNDIMEFYINKTQMNSLDMLNTKYIIYNDENKKNIYVNDDIPGSAWFVKENINVANDNDEILSLDSLNFKNISVSQDLESKKYKNTDYRVDLIEKKSNYLKYEVESDDVGLIIFSEIYYPHGWNSYVNGEKVSHFRFNYILRGLEVSNGKYDIEFKFEPEVVELSSKISLFSSISFILILITGLFIKRKEWGKKF